MIDSGALDPTRPDPLVDSEYSVGSDGRIGSEGTDRRHRSVSSTPLPPCLTFGLLWGAGRKSDGDLFYLFRGDKPIGLFGPRFTTTRQVRS